MDSPAIVWLRRDLRLADNPALSKALQHHNRIVPVYIHAPGDEGSWSWGAAQCIWLHHSLNALARQYAHAGSRLIIRRGPAVDVLRQLIKNTGAGAVYWNRLYEPAVMKRDSQIKQALRRDGVAAESFKAALMHEPWEVATTQNQPYKVFTPYWRRTSNLRVAPPLPRPDALPPVAPNIESLRVAELELLPDKAWHKTIEESWQFGEPAALRRLDRFLEHAGTDYKNNHDKPAQPGTSGLSPSLHFGEVSPGQVWQAITKHAEAEDKTSETTPFLRQLGWREFAHHLLYYFPGTPEQPLDRRFRDFPWARKYTATLRAWQGAETGIPLVDAAMRQLWHTGWMHNRMRMTVASLLTKNLRVPWQEGAHWFWYTLVDADLANNTLGWQWSAGSGADAAPYFRILNPVRQGERFDKKGEYVRRWLPELAPLPKRYIHAPWAMPEAARTEAGIRLGKDYPEPIVDLKASRKEALEAYQTMKSEH